MQQTKAAMAGATPSSLLISVLGGLRGEMREKGYYSVRTGKNPRGAKFDLDGLRQLVLSVYNAFRNRDFFQEAFGYECVDSGSVPGSLGEDVSGAVFLALRKNNLWPWPERAGEYGEDDLFDMLEFLYDQVSKPVDGYFHSYSGCGMHYSTFNRPDGQAEFRAALNPVLASYEDGFTLSDTGEILVLPEPGLAPLTDATLPPHDPENVEGRVQAAVARFRRHHASLDDRRQAVRDLADVLEFIRPKVKAVLTQKDEADLFNIANNFGVRHHNDQQKTRYEAAIWYSWMFYYYLATIHAALRLLAKGQGAA